MKKPLSLLLTLVLIIGVSATPNLNVLAAGNNTDLPTGFIAPTVTYKNLSDEEFDNSLAKKSYKLADNSNISTDNYWRKFSTPYYTYVDNMTDEQKQFYGELYEYLYSLIDGGDDFEKDDGKYFTEAIECTSLTNEQAENAAKMMMYNHPELYYLNGSYIFGVNGERKAIFLCVYDGFAKGEDRTKTATQLKEKIDSYLGRITGSNSYEKLKSINDIISADVTYDEGAAYDQSCASIFLNSRSVCAGYSESTALLAYAVGIPAISITSEEHEWNEVKLGDNWYILDVTWNDTGNTNDFFCKSETYMYNYSELSLKMHTPEKAVWDSVGRPECTKDFNPDTDLMSDIYRLYNPNTGEQFYTIYDGERTSLVQAGWSDEGIGWKSPATGFSNTPVYRVYSRSTGDHHYTMDEEEKNHLIAVGWTNEGIGWYGE